MTKENSEVFVFGDIRVDAGTFRLWKAGAVVSVEPKAFRVLLFLIRNRGRLIEKDELLDSVWKETSVTENALTREIAKLRRLLGDDPKQEKYIETVHTRGYRFVADVEVVGGANGDSGARAFEPDAGAAEKLQTPAVASASQNGFRAGDAATTPTATTPTATSPTATSSTAAIPTVTTPTTTPTATSPAAATSTVTSPATTTATASAEATAATIATTEAAKSRRRFSRRAW
ncbi:MAG TPA: transcriptional regulator, partial [Pyrinomonadaceae bacterium]|nr:transcriptional regulator [Pyrinomonadaceae bacterium]